MKRNYNNINLYNATATNDNDRLLAIVTLALSDQPKDWTVTSNLFNNIERLNVYSWLSCELISCTLLWKQTNVEC